ncbi:hypothetical protein TW95_gp1314 [Pandoravirus inopinatum]|uniref:Uncharacterized protein n=1 Tax=Pandoravirus inopinatum TaxID=1605721 RepID=A0A0B5IYT2_9VIRU|nr:hypothetical protein TW95_gp1314 [Pandoravirus inopinatum]AJF98048.1 hypothetical protein [Pandoravirus inopinatum]
MCCADGVRVEEKLSKTYRQHSGVGLFLSQHLFFTIGLWQRKRTRVDHAGGPATAGTSDDGHDRNRQDKDRPKDAAALLRDALECAGWDGRVDMRRLLLCEFDHNARVVRAYIATRPNRPIVLGAPCHALLSPWSAGAGRGWRVGRVSATAHTLADVLPLDDVSALACLTVSARYWSVDPCREFVSDDGTLWRSSWLSTVTDAIVDATEPFYGQVITRTLALARALLGLYNARARDHVLGRLDGDACQGDSLGSPDLARGLATYEAIVAACPPPLRRPCNCFSGDRCLCCPPTQHADPIQSAEARLKLLISFLQRLYETPPIYSQIIAPAEYAALCAHSALFGPSSS